MPYLCREIIEATGGALVKGSADKVFAAVSTDTREPQSEKLFIPLKGPRYDGHGFIGAAVEKGAAGLLVGRGEEYRLKDISRDVAVISVPDTLRALGDIACFWRKKFAIPLCAITGSAGKTTTKELTACIMGLIKNTLRTEGNFNNLVGLPLTLLKLNGGHELAILEMGTNVPGEIGRLSRIAAPDVGLITNIGPAHLEGLKTIETVREEKGALFRNLSEGGIAVVNCDDEAVRTLAGYWPGGKVTYGLKGEYDVTAGEIAGGLRGTDFSLKIGRRHGKVSLAAAGTHNVMNALAAAAAAWALRADYEIIRTGLQAFKPMRGRMEIRRLGNGAFLIDDSYNANPLSVREALSALSALKGKNRSVVILGDMLELGEQSERLHEEMGGAAWETGVDHLLLRGVFSSATAAGAKGKGMPASRIGFPDAPDDIADFVHSFLREGDWVLVKGSRAMKMEEVIKAIGEKSGFSDELKEG